MRKLMLIGYGKCLILLLKKVLIKIESDLIKLLKLYWTPIGQVIDNISKTLSWLCIDFSLEKDSLKKIQ